MTTTGGSFDQVMSGDDAVVMDGDSSGFTIEGCNGACPQVTFAECSTEPNRSSPESTSSVDYDRSKHRSTEIAPQKSRDRYGFILHDNSAESHRDEAEKLKLQNIEKKRTKKWLKMLSKWNKIVSFRSDKLKSRLRKGVPDPVRGEVWKKLARVEDNKRLYRDAYLFSNITTLEECVRDDIERDIARTFPSHDLFDSNGGTGQTSLRRILQLYAAYDPATGYCQGMGFVAGMFLTYMVEEDAFYALMALLQVLHRSVYMSISVCMCLRVYFHLHSTASYHIMSLYHTISHIPYHIHIPPTTLSHISTDITEALLPPTSNVLHRYARHQASTCRLC